MAFWPLLTIFAAWAGTAITVQKPGRWWLVGLFAVGVLAVAGLRLLTPWGWGGFALLGLGIGGWYLSLRPRGDRVWAPDVARIVTGTRQGEIVTLHDIRDFDWIDETQAHEHWREARVDLTGLQSADLFTSVWDSPEIAHVLISFGFADGQRLVFSVEIRREQGEVFSSIGGFFRQFELALIAATEADIIQLRTTHRGEDVRIYPLRLTPDQLRRLFLGYVDLGNRLAARPQWYNTITANCTTVVWQLARAVHPALPLDVSVLLSGRLPGLLHRLGLIANDRPLDEVRRAAAITEHARNLPPEAGFSDGIRAR